MLDMINLHLNTRNISFNLLSCKTKIPFIINEIKQKTTGLRIEAYLYNEFTNANVITEE